MKTRWNITVMQALWAATGVALALGLWLTAQSVRMTPDYARWIARKSGDVQQLYRMQSALRRDREAIAAFEALDPKPLVGLSDAIRQIMPGVSADVRQRESRSAIEGWTVRRMEVELNEAPLEQLGRLLYRIESSRPPWRLVECNLLASDRNPGHARVTLILEGLEKR